jgi:hypothetical protein
LEEGVEVEEGEVREGAHSATALKLTPSFGLQMEPPTSLKVRKKMLHFYPKICVIGRFTGRFSYSELKI